MRNNKGVPASPSGLRPFGVEPAAQSQAEPLVPNADVERIRRLHAASIAPKLGMAQKRVILSLTDDWGKAACHQTARRMFYGVTKDRHTVIFHKHRTDNCWRLSYLGAAVKDALIAQGMSAGTAKTPQAVEGEARQPGSHSECAPRREP